MDEVQALIEEFQAEVESRKRQLRIQAENLSLNLKNALHVELMKLPRKIRTMPVREFLQNYAGQVDAVAQAEYQQLYETIRTPSVTSSSGSTRSRPALTDETYLPPVPQSAATWRSGVAVKPMDMFKTIQSARRPAPQSALRQAISESLFDQAVNGPGAPVPATPLVSATYKAKKGPATVMSTRTRAPRASTLTATTTKTTRKRNVQTQSKGTSKKQRTDTEAAENDENSENRTTTARSRTKAKANPNPKKQNPVGSVRRPRRGDNLNKELPRSKQLNTLIATDDGSMIDIASPTTRRLLTKDHKKAAMEKLAAMQMQVSTLMRELRV